MKPKLNDLVEITYAVRGKVVVEMGDRVLIEMRLNESVVRRAEDVKVIWEAPLNSLGTEIAPFVILTDIPAGDIASWIVQRERMTALNSQGEPLFSISASGNVERKK
jgi:hypothetical protein